MTLSSRSRATLSLARQAQVYRSAFLAGATPDDVQQIGAALVERAKAGDIQAARIFSTVSLGPHPWQTGRARTPLHFQTCWMADNPVMRPATGGHQLRGPSATRWERLQGNRLAARDLLLRSHPGAGDGQRPLHATFSHVVFTRHTIPMASTYVVGRQQRMPRKDRSVEAKDGWSESSAWSTGRGPPPNLLPFDPAGRLRGFCRHSLYVPAHVERPEIHFPHPLVQLIHSHIRHFGFVVRRPASAHHGWLPSG
jgi:hypothetical protein